MEGSRLLVEIVGVRDEEVDSAVGIIVGLLLSIDDPEMDGVRELDEGTSVLVVDTIEGIIVGIFGRVGVSEGVYDGKSTKYTLR
jgi:hypothetical protein